MEYLLFLGVPILKHIRVISSIIMYMYNWNETNDFLKPPFAQQLSPLHLYLLVQVIWAHHHVFQPVFFKRETTSVTSLFASLDIKVWARLFKTNDIVS